jgi:hypothetical protein
MSDLPPKVFLDANVVIQGGRPPGGPLLARVADLSEAGLIAVLTTDLTKVEVAKKHAENDYEVIKEIGRPHFRGAAKRLLGIDLPEIPKADIKQKAFDASMSATQAMFQAFSAETLAIDAVPASAVLNAYSHGFGFFGPEGKKDQFPDAFIFERLKLEASATSPVIIISNDGDFTKPAEAEEHISVLASIPALFEHLGLAVEAPDIEEFLGGGTGELMQLADAELNDWGLMIGDVEDAEVEEVSVTGIEMHNLTSFGKLEKGDDILVIGTASIKATVSYSHPDWDYASYDSEDKVLIPHDTVTGEAPIELEADVSMLIAVDEGGQPANVIEFRFRNDRFQWVDIDQHDPYAYM